MPEPPEAWVWLARIRRPQGRKGEVFCDLLTDFPEKFALRRQVWLLRAGDALGAPGPSHLGTRDTTDLPPPRAVELTGHWQHKGGVVLHFAGIDSISEAEGLKAMMVALPRAERVALAADEAYISDLIGCTVVDVAGEKPISAGVIEDVDRTAGPAPLLMVRGAQGEVLIPFAKSYLRRIDLEAKRVEMALPEGLVDLNSFGET